VHLVVSLLATYFMLVSYLLYFSALKMEAKCSSETSVDFQRTTLCYVSRDSIVGIATGYGLDDRGDGVRVPVGSRIFSSPRRPDRLWGPPNGLSNGYRGFFPRGKAAGA
jgi:hypothetical protein